VETFTEFRPMIVDPLYQDRRRRCLIELNIDELDVQIVNLIDDLCEFPFCFTLQSCFGHFLYPGQEKPNNTEPLSRTGLLHDVEYRIAYVAFCIENSGAGREFLRLLKQAPEIDPSYIQFGCAEWFWERATNSYVLQVEPARHMLKDKCTIKCQEALHVEKVRNEFYDHLIRLVQKIRQP